MRYLFATCMIVSGTILGCVPEGVSGLAMGGGDGGVGGGGGVGGEPPVADFPAEALQPKVETGVARFLEEHPEYDGRGVIVAIFDTGVDPGAPGLQVTSDGKPKIIDLVDGSGSGDVDTSAVVEPGEDGTFVGLSGRTLRPNPAWTNPSGEYHLGLKSAFELFPSDLVGRLVREREDDFAEAQRAAVAEAETALAEWDATHNEPTREQLKAREDLELRLDQLKALFDDYDDPGPVYDCAVFNDGQRWRAVIDTDEDGDLSDEQALTNYRDERQHATFGKKDLLNFAVNIYEDGDLLSIVADVGAHGTHVAGIVAANYPDRPEINGIAPGAQIVSIKIGDSRLDSTSVGTGEVRGLVAVLRNKCDLINMSYGGPTEQANAGRMTGLFSDIVNEHGVIFVSSAGNEGPALSTVGSPGGTSSALIGVGAVVTPDMMDAQYSIRDPYEQLHYTWSCRGPTYDGDLGVDISAPGGAISPVPNWTLQGDMLMNGTSMASPNTCGSIALLLSGLKAEEIGYSPHTVRRALTNTARFNDAEDVFTQGAGMIQVDKAWEHLSAYTDPIDRQVRYEVSIADHDGDRGLYLREPFENDRPTTALVRIDPVFPKDADNREKVAFQEDVDLEATEPWVESAEHMFLMHGGRSFRIRVDPTGLEPGAHYAEIRGYDADRPERGTLFRVPITVIRTHDLDETGLSWRETIGLDSGQIGRWFFHVPEDATWADLTVRRLDHGVPKLVIVHAVQLVDGRTYDANQHFEYVDMLDGTEHEASFPVVGGRTMELDLAQYWSRLGEAEYELEMTFHGLVPDRESFVLDGGKLVELIDVAATLSEETIKPRGTLTKLRRLIRPSDADVHPLDPERDLLPENRLVHELILTYDLAIDADATVMISPVLTTTPEAWDEWESMIWQVFDEHKQRIAAGADPDSVDLTKGSYTVFLHVRNDDPEKLEAISDVPLAVEFDLDSPVTLGCYADPDDAVAGEGRFGTRRLARGESAVIDVAIPAADDLPELAGPGDELVGTISFGDPSATIVGPGGRPGGWPIALVVAPRPADQDDEIEAADEGDGEPPLDELAEEIRDLKVARLADLHDDPESFDRLADEILADWPDHLPVYLERLRRLDGADSDAVVAAADEVIDRIDQTALAAYFGVSIDEDDPEAQDEHERMVKRKGMLVEALGRKAGALLDKAEESGGDDAVSAFDVAFDELRAWADPTDDDHLSLSVRAERLHGRLGRALEMVEGGLAKPDADEELYEVRLELLDELGWSQWVEYERRWDLIRFPPGYPPF